MSAPGGGKGRPWVPRAGREIDGFRVTRVEALPGLRATAVLALHPDSGARVLHLHAPEDGENCFAVTIPTPPGDDTGLPHILEHAVLGGSKKFPVREPFFEMLRMSMATFINAMTAQAYTVYPVASSVKKDFYNLAEVYLDAVFHPLLTRDIFRREGHHLAPEDAGDPGSALRIAGIVYSEMRGACAEPEQLAYRLSGRGLFPGTPLGRDSGGDPERIPELSYARFRNFYRRHYHPGNALFFFYGDIPTREHLRFLKPVLGGLGGRAARVAAPRQKPLGAPVRVERAYPVGSAEKTAGRTFYALSWLVGDALDPAVFYDWQVLSALLLGNDAAPLKKALIDSKLGDDLFFAGAFSRGYEQEFHVGLKGSEPGRAGDFERLVLETLGGLASGTFDPADVRAAFQQVAYRTLEVRGLFPIHLLDAVNRSWPYGGDPLAFLRAGEHLDACRARYNADNRVFNRLVADRLLGNSHRLLVTLRPDRAAAARADKALAGRLAEKRAAMSDRQAGVIARSARQLAAAQGVPNSPEALAALPQLRVSDLPERPRPVPLETGRVAGVTVLRTGVFSNGVNYLQVEMDLAGLPRELYRWLPLFSEAVDGVGAAGQDFTRIARRRAACTGGLWSRAAAGRHVAEPDRTVCGYRFGLKTLDDQAEDALDLFGDIVFGLDPRDGPRLRDVLVQARAAYRTALVSDGLSAAGARAARGRSPEAAFEYLLAGPDTLRFIAQQLGEFEARSEEIMSNIERIRDFLSRAPWTVSFTGSDRGFRALARKLEKWAGARREGAAVAGEPFPFSPGGKPSREGLAGPLDVAHCAMVMPAPHPSAPETPLFQVGVTLAVFDHLLPEIRFKGNAYGGGARYNGANVTLSLYSYRDPRIVETLAVFDGLRDALAAKRWSRRDIERAVIGGARQAEKPLRPAEATGLVLARHRRGVSEAWREERYRAALGAGPKTVRAALESVLEKNIPAAAVCVAGNREKIEAANRRLGPGCLEISALLD